MPYTNIAATTAAVANRFVTSTNMKVGTYTIANASPVWAGGCLVTITHATVAAGTDTLGTVVIVGTDLSGAALTETITPVADSVATGTKVFRTVTSATGAGWVIAGGNDTLTIGCAAGSYAANSNGILSTIVVGTTAAATVAISDARGTITTLKSAIAEGVYPINVEYIGYLKIATTSTNDVTLIHSGTIPAYTSS